MSQLLAIGMLGLSGYAIYNRSQKLQSNNNPVTPEQELSARTYIKTILIMDSSTKALGGDLLAALNLMDWFDNPAQPSGDYQNKVVQFANANVQPMLYSDVFALNGLELMRLCNNVRLNPNSSPVIFDLLRRTVQKPILVTELEALKQEIDKIISG